MIYTLVPPDHVSKVWLKVLPYVRNLVDEAEGRVSEMALFQDMLDGSQMLWIAATEDEFDVLGFISTRINQYAKLRMASLEYCSGTDADEWFLGLMNFIEKWARDLGCDGLEMVCGRRGWTRKFRQAGFKDKFTWAEKRFDKDDNHGQGKQGS